MGLIKGLDRVLRRMEMTPKKASTPKALSYRGSRHLAPKNLAYAATIKVLYEGPNSDESGFDWVETPPNQPFPLEEHSQDRAGIKLYKIKDYTNPHVNGTYPLKYHKVAIYHPVLIAALEPIMKRENVHLDLHRAVEFMTPFRELWFCWEGITELYYSSEPEAPLREPLDLFLKVLDDIFSGTRVQWRNQQLSGLVGFETAWTLFPHGATVYSQELGSESIYKVEDTEYVEKNDGKYLIVKGKYMKFNGKNFVWRQKMLPIPSFMGKILVSELVVLPSELHPETDSIMGRLVARGSKAFRLQSVEYCEYNGIALHVDGNGHSEHRVEGRIMIDVAGYSKYHLAPDDSEDKKDLTPQEEVLGFLSDRKSVV